MFRVFLRITAVLVGLVFAFSACQVAASASEPVTDTVHGTYDRSNWPTKSPIFALTVIEDSAETVEDQRELAVFDALVEAGNRGAVNDGSDYTIYPHIGTVVDMGTYTATVTIYGLVYCFDANGEPDANGVPERCDGAKYLTDAWLMGSSALDAHYAALYGHAPLLGEGA